MPNMMQLKEFYLRLRRCGLARRALMVGMGMMVLDQASKFLVLMGPVAQQRVEITPFLDFILIWNKGISYGLFDQANQAGKIILIGLNIAICGFLLWMLSRVTTKLNAYGLGLIIGGAIGNIIDRVLHGAVVDFISLHTVNYAWYVFNVADIWITVGAILIILDAFVQPKEQA